MLTIRTVDSSLEPLPGVQVALLSVADGTTREVDRGLSDAEAKAQFEVGPGTYELRATLGGFLAVVVGPLTLDHSHRLLGDIVVLLPFAPQHESVICSSTPSSASLHRGRATPP